MKGLQIAPDFILPDEAVTQTFAILAKRGVGKTYLASVLVEEMVQRNLHVVVIDPTGAWWGLRAAANAKDAGLPVIILGGEHGDLPLTVDMAEGIAVYLAENPASMVLDLSLFSKADRARFMAPFAEKLYLLNRHPLHLVLDEADRFAPQRPLPDQNRMLGAIDEIVRMGRIRGLGVTMITQRPAVLNKDVLTQIEVLIPLRTIGPQDRKAIDAWIDEHGTPEQRMELMKSLPSLPIGTAWFWSPGWLDVFRKIQVRQRYTFNSSATPKVGEKRVIPKVMADVDVSGLQEALQESLKKAESSDVRALQNKIYQLTRQLDEKPKVEIQRVEVPILRDDQIDELKTIAGQMIDEAERLLAFGQDILALVAQARPQSQVVVSAPVAAKNTPIPVSQPKKPGPILEPDNNPDDPEDGKLHDSEVKILRVIARRHPASLTLSQIAVLSGRSIKSSSFQGSIGTMKRLGYISGTKHSMNMTEAGFAYLGDAPTQPQTAEEVLEMWRNSLDRSAAKIFDVLVDAYPKSLTKPEISERSGYSLTSSSFEGNLGHLRKNGLIDKTDDGYVASAILFVDQVGV